MTYPTSFIYFSVMGQFVRGYLVDSFSVRHKVKHNSKRLALWSTKRKPVVGPEVVGWRQADVVARVFSEFGEFLLRQDMVLVTRVHLRKGLYEDEVRTEVSAKKTGR